VNQFQIYALNLLTAHGLLFEKKFSELQFCSVASGVLLIFVDVDIIVTVTFLHTNSHCYYRCSFFAEVHVSTIYGHPQVHA
jgi:hypothetical protein